MIVGNSIVPRTAGLTWMSPINIPNSPDTGALDVDTNGNLFHRRRRISAVLVRSLSECADRESDTDL